MAFCGVNPKKHLGQHFLKDMSIAQRIAETITDGIYNMLEIGSGTGVLTQFLIQNRTINLKAIEIDSESYDYLSVHYPSLDIYREDFLKFDLRKIFPNQEFGVIGNFPYNISTQIIFKMLEHRERIPFLAGMFQKEVAERLCASSGSKTYGITSVLTQAYYHTEYLFTVSEQVFVPPPKVKSAVIRLIRRDEVKIDYDEKLFFSVVKTAFNQRRKTMRNSLKSFNVDLSEEIFSLRPEQIDYKKFIEITRLITRKLN